MSRPVVDASASFSFPEFDPSAGRPLPAAAAVVPPAASSAGPLRHGRTAPDDAPRRLAAHLLERTLLRLGRAGLAVERRLAPGLSRMHGRRLYRLLGYVRLADYLTERLGMSLRRCQAILRLA